MSKETSTSRALVPATLAPCAPSGRKPAVAYSPELAERILDLLAGGARWKSIAGKKGLPSAATLYRWEKRDPEFAESLAAARRAGAEWRADTVLDVAEAATKDTIQVDRLHIASLKWRVDRDTKLYTPKEEPDLGEGRRLVIVVRQFERVVREDGTAFVQEILPNGEVIDL